MEAFTVYVQGRAAKVRAFIEFTVDLLSPAEAV
jgi:hypothetical protein